MVDVLVIVACHIVIILTGLAFVFSGSSGASGEGVPRHEGGWKV